MQKKKRRVEIDVDGVLANMDGAYKPYILDLIPDFSEQKYIKSWGMEEVKDISPEAWNTIRSLWVNPEFIGSLHRFPLVEEGMKILNSIPDFEVVIHTHILDNDAVVQQRYNWIKRLEKDTDGEFTIDICVGAAKIMRNDSTYIIEDSVRNLNNSLTKNKFLVRRCHNRSFTEDDIVNNGSVSVVKNFYQAALLIYEDMCGKKYEAVAHA